MESEAKFNRLAAQWEDWCEELVLDSDLKKRTKTPAFDELKRMDKEVIPLIFARWKPAKDRTAVEEMRSPPWWKVLEAVTKKRLVSDAEKLAGLPEDVRSAASPEEIEVPALQEERWLRWWNTEGKKQFPRE
jgi:hypothetical protein